MRGLARTLLGVIFSLAAATAPAGPAITISPSPIIVAPGESVQLQATVRGPSQYQVKWILQGPLLDGTDGGTLTAEGLYTAPSRLPRGPIRVVAQVSMGQWNLPVAAASAPVTVVPPGFRPPEAVGSGEFGSPPVPPEPPPVPEFPFPPGQER